MLIELGLGYPQRLLRTIGHPVSWIGRLIDALDRRLNRETDWSECGGAQQASSRS